VSTPGFVSSADGTPIAVDVSGSGPPFVVVNGALSDRSSSAALVPPLADRHSVYAWDRRGRGDSGDTPPYAVAREVEDLAAVVVLGSASTGATVDVYGHSSGCYLAIEGVLAGLPVRSLVLHEPPFVVTADRPRPRPDLARRLESLVEAGNRDGAVRLFYSEAVALPPEVVDQIAAGPRWPSLLELAHTLPYDAMLTGTCELDEDRLGRITVPTLVVLGGASAPWMAASTRAVAAAIPHARHVVLEGQGHASDAGALAPEVIRFLDQSAT